MYILLGIIIVYIFTFFILTRFIIPHLSFSNFKTPEKIPQSMYAEIKKLEKKSKNPNEYLENSYKYLGTKFKTGRASTIYKFHKLFWPLNRVWYNPGIYQCTQNNFLLFTFLIKSRFFTEKDIKRFHTFYDFNIHQYLKINIDNKWIVVDVGESNRGLPIGKRLKLFGF